MNKRELAKFEQLLLAEHRRLGGHIRNIEEASRYDSGRDKGGDLSSYADAGTDSFDLETSLNIASGESHWLNEVADALHRLRKGTFGTCEGCEQTIPKKRLEAFPSARYCITCQEEVEKSQAVYR